MHVTLCCLSIESDSADEASLKELLSIPAVSITALAAFIASVSWVMPDPTLEPHLAHVRHLPTPDP